jgi:glycosyltransferase involved in cell wall biosynthesis
MRSALLAETLLLRGHLVTWWASTFDHFTKKPLFATDADFELRAGYLVRALKGCRYRRNVSLARYVDHGLIARKFGRLARKEPPPDVVVASMPDYRLAFEAARYAREVRIPLVVDVRDQWPDAYLEVVPAALRSAARWALARDFEKVRWLLSSADSLVAMAQELLEWALERAQRPQGPNDKVFHLGAAPPSAEGVGSLPARGWPHLAGQFVVTYVGTFGRYNNPLVMIDAARLLEQRLKAKRPIAFVLAGDGVCHSQVAERAAGLQHVTLPGWVGAHDLAQLLGASTVAVLPWSSTAPAFPNKAFHYLHAGLPIAASASGELRHLLLEYNAGFYFEPNRGAELAEILERWLEDGGLVAAMSANARRLARERFDGSRIYAEFATHVENVAAGRMAVA